MKRFTILALVAALVVPAMAAPTYWDFSGTVSVAFNYAGVSAGDSLTGTFWAENGVLSGLTSTVAGAGGDVNYSTDFVGWVGVIWDPTIPQISGTKLYTGTIALYDTSYTQVIYPGGGPTSYSTFTADVVVTKRSVVPAPGAILLAGIGTSLVGWLRRRRTI